MSEKEMAFWAWWKIIEPNKDNYNLRMAFDAGYEAKQLREDALNER